MGWVNVRIRSVFKVEKRMIREQPFPHFLTDNFFEKEEFFRLSREFPSEEMFLRNRQVEAQYTGKRIDLQKGDKVFVFLMIFVERRVL